MLLPVAAFSGWCVAKGLSTKKDIFKCRPVFSDAEYYMGLSFVLQNETDKAVDHLIKMLEVNSETVELHLALALLFRKKGEVDRSIRIHQNILTRPDLSQALNDQVLFELGLDYYAAGLLDRAEQVFCDLIRSDVYDAKACKLLINVYEKEKNWLAAINSIQRYSSLSNVDLSSQLSHYYCELALEFIKKAHTIEAIDALHKAHDADASNVRVNIIKANLLISQKRYAEANHQLLEVANKNSLYISEIIDPLMVCYDAVREKRTTVSTVDLLSRQGVANSTTINVISNDNIDSNAAAALAFIEDNVKQKASISVLRKYVKLLQIQASDPEVKDSFAKVNNLLDNLSDKSGSYLCHACGYAGSRLFWQCPSCKHWDSLKPI